MILGKKLRGHRQILSEDLVIINQYSECAVKI